MNKGFDLGAAPQVAEREDEGTTFHVRDECDELAFYTDDDGTEKPVTITVAGSYSTRFNRANERLQRRKWKVGTTAEEIQDAFREDVVAECILAWDGFFKDGKPAQLDKKHKHDAVHNQWLYPQISRAMDDHKSFFKPSSSDS
jgi:hypothetical protein